MLNIYEVNAMDNFVEALIADKCNTNYIPKEDDWFEGLIGD